MDTPNAFFIKPEFCEPHASFLRDIRLFFQQENLLEVETPLLCSTGAVEAHLDSFQVYRTGIRKSPQAPKTAPQGDHPEGYLITSPEYNMKILLSQLRRSIFQIAHCFRSGEIGEMHSEEFLLLEWYLVEADELELMEQCRRLFFFLSEQSYSKNKCSFTSSLSVDESLQKYAGCTSQRSSLEKKAKSLDFQAKPEEMEYSDLFYTIFLNLVEPHLGRCEPLFLYRYPKELASLSQIEGDYSRRFEVYWKGIELANAYNEIRESEEYRSRFEKENILRKKLNKKHILPCPMLLKQLKTGLPPCSGIALGLDRLFLILMGLSSLRDLYQDDL